MSNAENYLWSKKTAGMDSWDRMHFAMDLDIDSSAKYPTIDRDGVSITVVDRSGDWRKKMKKINDEQFKGLV